jgi:hypothetical protein
MGKYNLAMPKDAEELTDKVQEFSRIYTSGVYPMKIKAAYMSTGATGSLSVKFVCETPEGREFNTAQCIQSGDAKGNKAYFVSGGKKVMLPGWRIVHDILGLTAGIEMDDLDTEEKTIKIYDYDVKKEVATEVDMITDLIGEAVYMGIQEVRKIKQVEGDNGWEDTKGDDLAVAINNEVDKVFSIEDKSTLAESKAGDDSEATCTKWEKVNTDKVKYKKGAKDAEKKIASGDTGGGSAGAPAKKSGIKKAMFK